MSRSYGNYNSNGPQKTFAGQPRYATQGDLTAVAVGLESVQQQIMSMHPQTFHCMRNCPTDCSKSKTQGDFSLCMNAKKKCVEQCLPN